MAAAPLQSLANINGGTREMDIYGQKNAADGEPPFYILLELNAFFQRKFPQNQQCRQLF